MLKMNQKNAYITTLDKYFCAKGLSLELNDLDYSIHAIWW